jgi:hypothetical protein
MAREAEQRFGRPNHRSHPTPAYGLFKKSGRF